MADNKLTKKKVEKMWQGIKQNALTKMGWPNGSKLVEAARSNRGMVMKRLNFLANFSGDPSTKAKARSIIERIKRELGND
jgi:hypothetical protein